MRIIDDLVLAKAIGGGSQPTPPVPPTPAEAPENDVEFIDYDGTIVYSYTAEQFLALTEMPANPTHEGLTAQGWNWSLADAKEYVGDYGGLVIGQMYITDDGKTRIYIEIPQNAPSNRLTPIFNIDIHVGGSSTSGFLIDYGDGSSEHIVGTGVQNIQNHTYSSAGNKVITLTADEGVTLWLGGSGTSGGSNSVPLVGGAEDYTVNGTYKKLLYKVEIGESVAVANGAFCRCSALRTITIPNTLTTITQYCFYGCSSLQAIIIPSTASSVGTYAFYECFLLGFCAFSKGISTIPTSLFYSCKNLHKIFFPNSITTINAGVFYDCGIECLIIPSSVTSLNSNGDIANSCKKLKKLIYKTTKNIPRQMCYLCESLSEAILSEGATSIGVNAFTNCYSLEEITIPLSITSINSSAFSNCQMGAIVFKGDNPPTLSASSAFNFLPTDCVIYVPYSEDHSILNAYKTATNYPNPSTYTYVEY